MTGVSEAGDELDGEHEQFWSGPSAENAAGEDRALSFGFHGDAREYFRIWIVNLCLSVFTLGVFSAWAKVRKKRYLYSHTLLDGSPFQYLGQPIPIFKGRLVATALAATWYVFTHFFVQLLWAPAIIGLVAIPWVLVRSAAFNARYSAYRNMTFRFSGSYWGAVRSLIGPLLLTIVSCGLAYPWLRAKLSRYFVTGLSFGGIPGEFRRSGGHFLKYYVLPAIGVVALIAALGVSFAAHGRGMDLRAIQRTTYATYVVYFLIFVYLKARITNLIWDGTMLGSLRFESSLPFRGLLWLYLVNSVAVLASAGLLVPWAVIRSAKYRAAHFAVFTSGPLEHFEGSARDTVRAAGSEVGEFFDLDVAL